MEFSCTSLEKMVGFVNRASILDRNFWSGKRVLVTGHTGFKGGWLTLWLNDMGAKVCGVSLPPNTSPNLFELAGISSFSQSHLTDIRDLVKFKEIVSSFKPEIAFHLAAQPLVRQGYIDPTETFSTNVMGTVNFLEAIRVAALDSIRSIVVITTDKVYKNLEWFWPYRETDELGGHDPYSASKAACELVVNAYKHSFFENLNIPVATARAGNVIGGGDWSPDRLIPDLVRSFKERRPLEIRRPNAVRPWQHVLEPLYGYLVLAQKIYCKTSLAGEYNFGPNSSEACSVKDVVEIARRYYDYDESRVEYAIEEAGFHEASVLSLDVSKARMMLNVNPRWDLSLSVKKTINWYINLSTNNAYDLCMEDIREYLGNNRP